MQLFSAFKKKPLSKSSINTAIFGDYDIRGRYPQDVNEEIFFMLSEAIVSILKPKSVIVGRDSRLSSQPLSRALMQGFASCAVEVIDAGLTTATQIAWIARKHQCAACMVTASHNPAPDNGIKLYNGTHGAVYSSNGMEDIQREFVSLYAARLAQEPKGKEENVQFQRKDFSKEYQEALLKHAASVPPRLRLALDYSSGTTGLILNDILERKRISYATLHERPDGHFPGHGPNPLLPESQEAISQLIRSGSFSLGALFDADGDRVLFFDEKGRYIDYARIAALIVEHYLPKERKYRGVVVTVSDSKIISDVIRHHKGKVLLSPVGRTRIAPLMRTKHAFFGVERSGHYFFRDFEYEDCGIFMLFKVLSLLAEMRRPLSKLVEPYARYETLPEISIPLVPETEYEVYEAVRQNYRSGMAHKIDGLTIELRDWWFNLRRSRTEPIWRLSLEGEKGVDLERRRAEIEGIITKIK